LAGTRRLADFNANPGSFMQGEEEDEGPDGFADFWWRDRSASEEWQGSVPKGGPRCTPSVNRRSRNVWNARITR